MEKEKDGVWRTIRGRRIFIGKGESLGQAMSKSGKFKNLTRTKLRETRDELRLNDNSKKWWSSSNKTRDKIMKKMRGKDASFIQSGRQAEKNRINEYAHIEGSGQTRVQRNWNKYSEADRREHRHELIQKKLADYKAKKQSNNKIEDYKKAREEYKEKYGNLTEDEKIKKALIEDRALEQWGATDKARKQIEKELKEAGIGKQSNNKINNLHNELLEELKHNRDVNKNKNLENSVDIDYLIDRVKDTKQNEDFLEELKHNRKINKEKGLENKVDIDYAIERLNKQSNNKVETERELYERAKNNPDSIDPMTENSTDWEALEKKYGNNESYPRAKGATKFEDLGLDIKDKKAFSDYLQDKYGTDDFRIINFDNKENAKQIYQEFRDKQAYDTRQEEGLDKFIQHTDMYGGTREYSNEELKRMEEQGIRPMSHSYTGGGWEGVNSNLHLDTKDQAKRITDAVKKKYPDVKVARKTNLFSGGSSIDFNIMSSDKDLFVSDKDIDKMGYEDLHSVSSSNGFEWWAKDNIPNYNNNAGFTIDDVRKYAKESLNQRKQSDIQSVRGNEWYLSDYGKKVVSDLNKEANSYTYSDSDGMVDYFDHGTYMHISIGKWNKPYQVNESKKIKDYVSKKKSNHK